MAKTILMDEFHLSVRVPPDLPPAADAAIRRTLDRRRFRSHLGRAVRDVVRSYPALHPVRITLTR